MHKNVGVFAAFKNHHHVLETIKLLTDENGNPVSKKIFIEEAKKINDLYNKQWLNTEYDHAYSAAIAARKWNDAVATSDIYPNLMYVAVNDDRTRLKHKAWHGIILPISHPFWNTHLPPNDYGCRCSFRRTDKPVDTKGIAVDNMPALPTMFNTNYGKESILFDKSHPYYDLSKTNHIKAIKGFNFYKSRYPEYYTTKGGVRISKWADELELKDNYRVGALLSRQLGAKVYIRPDLQLDSRNPEYMINGLIADRKTPQGYNNIRKHLDTLKKQAMAVSHKDYYGVFELDRLPVVDLDRLTRILAGKITKARGRKIKGLYFTLNNKAVYLSREELVRRDYSNLYKIQ